MDRTVWAVSQSKDMMIALRLPPGIASVELTVVGERPSLPPPNINKAAAVAPQPWVPWHLDRIDQHSLPLDGKFTANATGTGVHVFVISSVGALVPPCLRCACLAFLCSDAGAGLGMGVGVHQCNGTGDFWALHFCK